MLEQICNPLAISDIGLSSRYLLSLAEALATFNFAGRLR
jgi:hypothetical protein